MIFLVEQNDKLLFFFQKRLFTSSNFSFPDCNGRPVSFDNFEPRKPKMKDSLRVGVLYILAASATLCIVSIRSCWRSCAAEGRMAG